MIIIHINRKKINAKPGKYYTVAKSKIYSPVVTRRYFYSQSQSEKFLIYFPAESGKKKHIFVVFLFCNTLCSSSYTVLRACNLIVHQNLSSTMHYTTQHFGFFYADRPEQLVPLHEHLSGQENRP